MIKFYISYFYQIRHMEPNMLPVSTAMWDPKWFHDGKNYSYHYFDKNHILNGIRMVNLMMPFYKWEELVNRNESCIHCGTNNGADGAWVSGLCPFMQEYSKCIRENNPDFQKFITFCEGYLQFLNNSLNICLDTIIFIVHEPPYKRCGERPILIKWFKENGMELEEYEPC